MAGFILILAAIALGVFLYTRKTRQQREKIAAYKLPASAASILEQHVAFYAELNAAQKAMFLERVRDFLARTAITPVSGAPVQDMDKLFIAAGAIIPIFSFDGWRYNNIDEVLVYNNTFSKDFAVEGEDRNILGMVGDGALNRKMLLSLQAIRNGFMNPEDGRNTVIHEFVHLLDKADGSVDGVPEYLLSKQYDLPWKNYMHNEIQHMRQYGSDINQYGATNEAEFLAVISEYFFERPHQLEENHPELYLMLSKMFIPVKK